MRPTSGMWVRSRSPIGEMQRKRTGEGVAMDPPRGVGFQGVAARNQVVLQEVRTAEATCRSARVLPPMSQAVMAFPLPLDSQTPNPVLPRAFTPVT